MTAEHATVLRLITRLNIGGPARQALLLTKELRESHPTVLAVGTPPAVEGELLDPEVPIRRVPLVRPIDPRADVAALRQVRALLSSSGARILHTHTAKAGSVGRVAASTVRHRPRTVHTFHGHVLEGYFSPAVQRTFIGIERALARRTDRLVAISPEIRDELLDLGIGRASQYEVIPLGFDLARHLAVTGRSGHLRDRLALGTQPLVGIVGRLAPIKDVATALRAMVELDGVHLAVVGDGELRGALAGMAQELGIAERVHFVGWEHDVPAVLADLDAVVLTSRNEGTPVALIEALAAARPVVATDVGGVRSVVTHDVTGYLVPPSDACAVASRLRQLLADGAAAHAMAARGRAHVQERFSDRRLVADVRALYDDLLG